MKRFILIASITLFINGVAFSQEPLVVTTVNNPAERNQKADIPLAREIPAKPVKDTTSYARVNNNGLLNGIVLHSNSIVSFDKTSIGLGLGLDYGGFGGNLLYYPQKNIGLFCGIGYNLVKVGFNLGIKSRIPLGSSTNHISLSALAMYGYNAVIKVEDHKELNKVFYGFTLGAGVDLRPWRFSDDYMTLAILVPFRGSEVRDYIDNLKYAYSVVFENELFPVAISIGYRIVFE